MTAAIFFGWGHSFQGCPHFCIHDLFRSTAAGRTDHSINVMKTLFGSGTYVPKGATSANPALR